MSIENAELVLSLNKNWQPIGKLKVRDAFVAMSPSDNKEPSCMALDITYELDENANPIFDKVVGMTPTTLDKWIELPIMPWHSWITTPRAQIRVPTVIVSTNYADMPKKRPVLSAQAIWERDQYTCQYTGKKLSKRDGNIDHIIPKAEWKRRGLPGNPDNWTNMVLSSKEVNTKKGDRTNEEAGLKLLRKPVEPRSVPVWALITEAKHKDWSHFLIK